jgi:CYTH domain-containing protein
VANTGDTTTSIEIERKWLVERVPTDDVLAALGARRCEIEQVYLRSADPALERRVRRERSGGRARYRLTEKRRLDSLARTERERSISAAEHAALLEQADPGCRPVRKTRHRFDHAGLTMELDVYVEPAGLCVLEVELPSRDRVVSPPAILGRLRDVSGDPAYDNAMLARRQSSA